MAKDSRHRGLLIENHVRQFLQRQGMVFIAQNYHSRYGEIDLIFLHRNSELATLVFVEVRYRKGAKFGSAAETVDFFKQQKIIKTAQAFLQKEPKFASCNARFDVVSITKQQVGYDLDWQQNAFQANAW